MRFPRDFLFGAATSAYQIEGAFDEDGKGASIWDRFCRRAGAIEDGSTGDVACDHYHRYREDVALMADLGLGAYRFSISWPRIVPAGSGAVEERGLAFYERLVDALLAAGIRPFATLYHWDLPQALQDAGGWAAPDTAKRFAELAQVVGARLGDRVHDWMTLNEPEVIAFVGHAYGEHAPGLRDPRLALDVAHQLLLAHRAAAEALRASRADSRVGIVCNLGPCHAASEAPDDVAAARRVDGYLNRWWLDPLFGRGYPADMVEHYRRVLGWAAPALDGYDGALDLLGVNYYSRRVVKAGDGKLLQTASADLPGAERTTMGWEVYPPGLSELLLRVTRDYRPRAIYITENGASFDDEVRGGAVDDPARERYLASHLAEASRAIEAGAPLRGYFVWSLLDNFEWQHGYTKRFGIVHVDYATQRRTAKRSARWYRALLRRTR